MNEHNSSHPLVKLKTPIRNVLVTTTDNTNTIMGDTLPEHLKKEESATTNTATQVQTIANVEPTEEFAKLVEVETPVLKVEEETIEVVEEKKEEEEEDLSLKATFLAEGIPDGTNLTVGMEFTQTWYMKNTGKTAWPAGVTVKFVGGDYMFLKSEEDSLKVTVTENEVQPGDCATFAAGLSATWPPNKPYISYWRMCAPDGTRFGDRLWCSINVSEVIRDVPAPAPSEVFSSESVVDAHSVRSESVNGDDFESIAEYMLKSQASSQMVFPKLEVESPVNSLAGLPEKPANPGSHKTFALSEDGDVEEEIDVSSIGDDESFLTDEEYDVLDASDEEFEQCERVN